MPDAGAAPGTPASFETGQHSRRATSPVERSISFVELIRVSDQAHVWSHSYESSAASLLTLQQELSAAIAEQIRLRLTSDRSTIIGRRQTRSGAAYDLYLRARFQAHRRTADGNARAIELYRRAIDIDPD